MSSNLRVNNIFPSVGTNVAIGTAGGSITLTGGVTGSDLTLTGGINATGVLTATTFSGNLTGNVNSTGVTTVTTLNIGTGTSISSPASNTLTLGTNSVERVRIDSSGRLGIGTVPTAGYAAKLTVASNALSSGSSSTDGGIVLTPVTSLSTGQYTPAISFSPNPGAPNRSRAGIAAVSNDATNGMDLVFLTRFAADGTELTLSTDEKVRITSTGNLGIGTNNPTKALHISQNSDVAIRMHSGNCNTNARSWEIVVGGNASNNAEMVFRTRNDAGTGGSEAARFTTSGNLAFPSGQGIDFSATANSSGTMTSELLNDYETGTWTPIAGSNAGSITSYLSGGNYTKIGDTVRVNGYINITNQGTANGQYLNCSGLPFTSSGGIIHIGVCREQSVNGYLITAQVSDNITTAFFSRWDNSGVIINGNFHFTIVYKTSS